MSPLITLVSAHSPISLKSFESPKQIGIFDESKKNFLTPIELMKLTATPSPNSAFKIFPSMCNISPMTHLPSDSIKDVNDDNGITFGDAVNTVMNCYYDK